MVPAWAVVVSQVDGGSGVSRHDVAADARRRRREAGVVFRVCHGVSCTQLGAKQVGVALRALLNTDQPVECGCLGDCGRGPNVVAGDAERQWKHYGVRGAKELGVLLLDTGFDTRVMDACLAKDDASILMSANDPVGADNIYSKAIQALLASGKLETEGTKVFYHTLLINRSIARAEFGQMHSALADANAAVDSCPASSKAWLRKAETHAVLNDKQNTESALAMANRLGPASAKENTDSVRRLARTNSRSSAFLGGLFGHK